jgi:hypothetical protein
LPEKRLTKSRMASLPTEDAGTGAISPGKGGLFSKAGMDAPHGGTRWWVGEDSNLRQTGFASLGNDPAIE